MSGYPLVSAIIPTHNRANIISFAIDSLLNQTYPNVEIIIVDDGSTDNTEALIKRKYAGKVNYIYQPRSERSRARNRGVEAASGEYIQFLDSDDTVYPKKIERQVEVFESKKNNKYLGMVYSWGYFFFLATGQRRPWKSTFQGKIFKEWLSGNFIPPHALLIKKSCIEEAGGFDENISFLEDWDLWLRIAKKYEVTYIDEYLWDYVMSGNNLGINVDLQKIKDDILYFFTKHKDSFQLDEEGKKRYISRHFFVMGYFSYYAQNFPFAEKSFLEGIIEYPENIRGISREALGMIEKDPYKYLKLIKSRISDSEKYAVAIFGLLNRCYQTGHFTLFRLIFLNNIKLIFSHFKLILCWRYLCSFFKKEGKNDY